MPNVSLGDHFESFIARQIADGRFQSASEVVRAGLRLLEDSELKRSERLERLKQDLDAAFDAPGADVPAETVFERLEQQFLADRKQTPHGA
jgi:antitoxin ParD1/3/4